jgi:large subunit ribosomal protein L5
MAQRLKTVYLQSVVPRLREELSYNNWHQVPRLEKVVINCGLGEASQNARSLESTLRDLSSVAGQKPIVTRARKSIAGFQVRAKMPVGVCVTLRGEAMYAFLGRLIHLALPRIRDFQGLNWKSFDGYGNFHLGLKEQLVFPEIDYDKVDRLRGMNICIVTTCRTHAEGLSLLTALGMPFQPSPVLSSSRKV